MADFGIGAAILGSAALAGITGFIGNKSAAKVQSEAAQTAARATGEASEAAIAEQRRQYDQTRTDLAPYRQAGRLALGDLAGQIQTAPQGFQAGDEFKAPVTYQPGEEFTRAYGYQPGEEFTRAYGYDPAQFMTPELLGEFSNEGLEQDPGYQFRQAEGEKALQRGASAKGLSLSGGALKDLSRFNQGLASEEYGSAYGRYLDRYQSRVSDLLRRTELSRYGYETSQADLARRQSLSRYGYETSQADLARRQALGFQQYGSVLADLARRYGIQTDEYNTGRAASDTQFNRLAGLAGVGQTSVNQTASAGSAAATNIAQSALAGGAGQAEAALAGGQARGAGILGSFGSINRAAQGGLENALTLEYLNKRFPGGE
jgi:type II secretory pathway pseudopilin PulG